MWFRAGRVGVAWRLPLRSSSPVSYVSSIRDLRYTLAQDGGIRLFSSDTMTRHRIEKITADLFPNDPRTEELVQLSADSDEYALTLRSLFRESTGLAKYDQMEPTVYHRHVDALGRAYGTGRRKDSVARVWIKPGSGTISINGRALHLYFPRACNRDQVIIPFEITDTLGKFDVLSTARGGGLSGQAGALRLGISRALLAYDPSLRTVLKDAGFLSRDPRVVERKKPGQKKARKKFAWVKR